MTIDLTSSTEPTEPTGEETVTVNASDLLWVLTEFGILAALTEKQGMPEPPSMDAALRLVDAIPEQGVTLPAEAEPSLMLATILAGGL